MVNDQKVGDWLLEAMERYHPFYDEIFWQVNARIGEHGEAGKLELAALICWKRSA